MELELEEEEEAKEKAKEAATAALTEALTKEAKEAVMEAITVVASDDGGAMEERRGATEGAMDEAVVKAMELATIGRRRRRWMRRWSRRRWW